MEIGNAEIKKEDLKNVLESAGTELPQDWDAINRVCTHYGFVPGKESSFELGMALLPIAQWMFEHPWAPGLFVWGLHAQLVGDPDENLKRLFKEDLDSPWYSDEQAQKRRAQLEQEELEDQQDRINDLLKRAAEIAEEAKMANLSVDLRRILAVSAEGDDSKEG